MKGSMSYSMKLYLWTNIEREGSGKEKVDRMKTIISELRNVPYVMSPMVGFS